MVGVRDYHERTHPSATTSLEGAAGRPCYRSLYVQGTVRSSDNLSLHLYCLPLHESPQRRS